MREIKAPQIINTKFVERSVFLAGSIEMNKAENWQERITKALTDLKSVVVLNPRRDDWDSSWIQSIENPKFKQQVEWELKAMENADAVVVYFDPNTKSPITLLELGLRAKSPGFTLVYCPEGFWRKGNVDIVCKRYGIEQVENEKTLIERLRFYISP